MARSPTLPLVLAAATALGASGCFWVTTKSEGKTLRRDVDTLETRLQVREEELEGKVAELQQTLDDAAKLLKRNSADLGADVQRIDEEQRKLLGLLTAAQASAEEVRQGFERYRIGNEERLAAMEARLLQLEQRAATPPMGPDEMWTKGKAAFEAGRMDEARELFRALALGHPDHRRAPDAQYFRAETHFAQKDHDGAIREYLKVYDKYPQHDLADDALFRAGEAAEALKNCTEAMTYFAQLRQKYPKSNLVKRAEAKEKELRAAAKDKKKCSS